VGVHDEGVGAVAALEDVAALGQDRGRSPVGGVDVQPEPLTLADVGDGRNRVHARGRGRRHRGGDRERRPARGPIGGYRVRESDRVHAELPVDRDLAEALLPNAEDDGRLLDRGVGLLGGVHAQAGLADEPAPARVEPRDRLAGRGEGDERRSGGGVLDHPEQTLGLAEELSKPVEDHGLELRRRRGRPPQHPVDVEGGRDHLPEDARGRRGDREVGEEGGVVPVSDAGKDLPLDVGQDRGQGLALLRRRRRELRPQLARAKAREHGEPLPFGEVAGDPVDEAAALLAEDLEVDVSGQASPPR
jgi:hypothetical protein